MSERTIAAISTPPGVGGIAVIRISGADAVKIAAGAYVGKSDLINAPTHTIHYGHIADTDGRIIDEVLVSIMRSPKSFTGEDVVEIGTHGGTAAAKMVLKALIANGASPAGPGEFTKRAFLNGKIDLSEAEGVIDIINARNEIAELNAVGQASGRLSRAIEDIRHNLLSLAASMQVLIDYPDEDLSDVTIDDIKNTCEKELKKTQKLIKSSEQGKLITDGILTAIVGRPNVGKSSLLNILAGEERAIVTEIAGTTRDVIEESVNLDGVVLRLMDTAGIRQTDDRVEKIGVMRSMDSIKKADLILAVFDASEPLSEEDRKILADTENSKRIIIINKTDLGENDDFPADGIRISAKNGNGIDELSQRIRDMYNLGEIGANDAPIVTNMRHTAALCRAEQSLKNIVSGASAGTPSDILSIDLNDAINALGEITGAVASEDIVNEIFHNFCVGK